MRFSASSWSILAPCLFVPALLGVLAGDAWAQADDFKDRLPRIPPLEPATAMKSFTVEPGFRIEQVAAEPLVHDPVAMSFDENGRLFVCEMCDYSEDDKANLGVIRLLEDTDDDGRFDKSTPYVEGLSWPTAVQCYDGGVFVAAAPFLYYCKDTDGDGRADVKRLVYQGFHRSNVQGLVNCLRWGLDNRLHGATSTAGGELNRADTETPAGPDAKSKPSAVRMNGRDFSMDPRTRDLRLESGGGQHGMSFDDWGRKFVSSNSDHIQLVMFEDRYMARNKFLAAPSPRVSIAADGPAAPVFRTSPIEPWRIVRTELRVSGKVPGIIEGGGKPAGYFTGATGVTIYRGDAWPAAFQGNAFIGDVGSNLVHRKILEPAGLELRARRADEGREFIASSDIWFRPCQFGNAPDGTLYVLDVYREVIEHPAALPPSIKKHLDLTSGRDRGRIYRVVPEGFKPRPGPRLGKASTAELVALLEHPNGWHRETAARLLYERNDAAAKEPLVKLAAESKSPLGRMHALYALDGITALTPEVLLARLADADPRVREHAVRFSESLAFKSTPLAAKLCELAADPDRRVRYQLAFTLGDLPGDASSQALAKIAALDAADPWVRLAVLSSLSGRADAVFAQLADLAKFRATPAGQTMLGQLAHQVGLATKPEQVAIVLHGIEALPADERPLARAVLGALGSGLSRSGGALGEKISADGSRSKELLTEILRDAKLAAADAKLADAKRVEAIRALGLASLAASRDALVPLLDGRQPQAVQMAAVDTLARFREPDVADFIVSAWPNFSPGVRASAAEALFARPDRLPALLTAIGKGQISATQLDPARVQFLLTHQDVAIREQAGKVLADAKLGRRADVVAAHRDVLELKGDVERGRAAFRKICSACHRLENVGHETAPNLATIQNRGAEAILLNVLDPNREVNPQYVNYIVVTDEGRSITGMIASETATSITLRRAEGQQDTVLRSSIDELKSTGLSIMPEGIEKQLDKQALADVIAYLLSIR